jgi:hypothetical protein
LKEIAGIGNSEDKKQETIIISDSISVEVDVNDQSEKMRYFGQGGICLATGSKTV